MYNRKIKNFKVHFKIGDNMNFFTSSTLFIIILIGYWIQSIAGFGAIIFALPLSLFLVDKSLFLPVILFMSIIQSLAIVYKDHRYINRKKFITMLSLAGMGIPFGIITTDYLDQNIANYLLGSLIILNSIYTLYLDIKEKKINNKIKNYHYLYPFFSGVLQTAYGMGGPLIGTYMNKQTEEKRTYRVMISLYWCILNPFIIFGYFFKENIDIKHLKLFLLLFPAVILGYLLGNFTIDNISQKKFECITHTILIIIGFTLFFK